MTDLFVLPIWSCNAKEVVTTIIALPCFTTLPFTCFHETINLLNDFIHETKNPRGSEGADHANTPSTVSNVGSVVDSPEICCYDKQSERMGEGTHLSKGTLMNVRNVSTMLPSLNIFLRTRPSATGNDFPCHPFEEIGRFSTKSSSDCRISAGVVFWRWW